MSKRTRTIPAGRPPLLPPPADPDAPGALEAAADVVEESGGDLSRVMNELGEDANSSKVMIWRIREGERKGDYIDELRPSEFSLKWLADNHGGGRYKISVYAPVRDEDGRPTGNVQLVKNPIITIAGAPKEPRRMEPAAPAPAAGAPAGEIAAVLQAVNQGFMMLAEKLSARPPEKTVLDQLREVTELKKLILGDAPPAPKPADPMDQVTKVLGLVESIKDLAGPKTETGELAQLAKGIFTGVMNANKVPPAAPAEPAPAPAPAELAQPLSTPAPTPQPVTTVIEDDPMNLVYLGYVMQLVKQARANEAVEPIAAKLYDQLPDEFIAKLLEPGFDYLALLAQFSNDVRLFPEWFKRLHAALLAEHGKRPE